MATTPRPKINVTRASTIARLKAMGLPVLPVAPIQNARMYPAKNRQGEILRDEQGQPKPRFTGKNPSYLDGKAPRLIKHRQFQSRLPYPSELRRWFEHPNNGVMTMGGWGNIIWIDIDVKRYSSQGHCDRSVKQWIERYPRLEDTWIERTHSGGWRFAIRVDEMPDFTNFGFRCGQHIGEILGWGRLTVLAPTIGPSGNPYVCMQRRRPIHVASVADIGLKPTQRASKRHKFTVLPTVVGAGTISLIDLVNQNVGAMLQGQFWSDDRSLMLTTVAKELCGWQNWCEASGLPLADDPNTLIMQVAELLEIDDDRVDRILKSVQPPDCLPAIILAGNDVAAWRKVKQANWELYRTACPVSIQRDVQGNKPKIKRREVTV